MTLTREQLVAEIARLKDRLEHNDVALSGCEDGFYKWHIQLHTLALERLDMEPLKWNDAAVIPDVERGGMGYYLVATAKSKTVFGAIYLNAYPLQMEDQCPDATKENGWTCCTSCDNGDGHPSTGWFEETKEDGDRDMYYPMNVDGDYAVKVWAEPPVNPISSLPTPKDVT